MSLVITWSYSTFCDVTLFNFVVSGTVSHIHSASMSFLTKCSCNAVFDWLILSVKNVKCPYHTQFINTQTINMDNKQISITQPSAIARNNSIHVKLSFDNQQTL